MKRAPQTQSMELRKKAKPNFVLKYVIASECESSFLLPILEANISMSLDADGSAPPVKETNNGQKVGFSTSIIICSLGIQYASCATLRMRIEHFNIKERSAETLIEENISFDI